MAVSFPPGGLKGKTSAVNTTTSSSAAKNRINSNSVTKGILPGAKAPPKSVLSGSTVGRGGGITGALGPVKSTPQDGFGTTQNSKKLPTGLIWNLPPHEWSLPTLPSNVDSVNGKRNFQPAVNTSSGLMKAQVPFPAVEGTFPEHGLRRGRIWFYDTSAVVQNLDAQGNLAKNDKLTGANKSIASGTGGTGLKGPVGGANTFSATRNYGFQFLWNPETIKSAVFRNMDVTPSSADALRVVSGAFPGQEQFTVEIVLDRVNDFACAKGAGIATDSTGKLNKKVSLDSLLKFYIAGGQYFGADDKTISRTDKLKELLNLGTMADLEYLFKAINGTLQDSEMKAGVEWTNLLGKKTANIGYLQPSLMGFQFGPTLSNLAWVGWITQLSLNHTMFTQNMIPLRTEVTISVDAFTGSGVSST